MDTENENLKQIDKYVSYLIQDLEEVTKKEPVTAYYEKPVEFEDHEDIAELALSPYKTIEDFTGIAEESFPDVFLLNREMIEKINKAIFKVYDWLHLELIDKPKKIPPEVLYEALRFHWDLPVQYLPSSGMDVELCAGDIQECMYGEYCDYCNADFSEEDFE